MQLAGDDNTCLDHALGYWLQAFTLPSPQGSDGWHIKMIIGDAGCVHAPKIDCNPPRRSLDREETVPKVLASDRGKLTCENLRGPSAALSDQVRSMVYSNISARW